MKHLFKILQFVKNIVELSRCSLIFILFSFTKIIMKKQALFIDRDGVINHMIPQTREGFDSPQTINQVHLVEGVAELIRYYNQRSVPVIEISNQPGAAKGKMSLETQEAIEKKVHSLLLEQGARVDGVYRCFHHPQAMIEKYKSNCDCRKPKPGLLLQAAHDLDIDLTRSVFLGDNVTDMEAGLEAGCTVVFFFHENDTPAKVEANRLFQTPYKVTSHTESLSLLTTLLS